MTKSIRDVLKNKGDSVVSIDADATVYSALELMASKNVGALLVMKGEQVATGKVLYITPDKSVEEGLALMSDKRCRHLPVLEDKALIGMVSIGDLVQANIAEKEFMISQLEHYILGS